MTCPRCSSPMNRGGVRIVSSAWRPGAAPFAGDHLEFFTVPSSATLLVIKNGWQRDALHCARCDGVFIYDGRKPTA